MKLTKKVIALVMAVVMLTSVFAVSTSALSYSPTNTTGDIAIIVKADKTEVAPGDVVTFSICIDPGSYGDFGAWYNTIIWNSSLIAPTATTNTAFRTYVNEAATWINQAATANFNYPIAQLTALTTEEKAYYDKAVLLAGTVDSSMAANSVGSGWTPASADNAQMTFTMQVAADAAAGSEIWVGVHQAGFTKGVSYISKCGGSRFAVTNYNLTNSMVKLTVGSDEPSLTVENNKNQIRYGKNSRGEYAGQVDIRNVAKIAATEFEAIDVSRITEAGFVYAPSTTTFSAETAQAVAKGTTTADGYAKATVGTIYDEGDYYTFSCLVYGIDDADIATAAYNCYAYIAVDGEYWFFYADAVAISALSLYNTHLANANTAYGWTLAAK